MRQSRAPETFRVKSFGCQMNVYDGERMAELLADKGLRAAPDGEEADLVVLNTCHIREKAAEKVYSDIGRLVKAGKEVGFKVPVVVRLEGTNVEKAREILNGVRSELPMIQSAPGLTEAAKMVVAAAAKA